MVDEKPTEEEIKPSFLEEIKKLKEDLDKSIAELKELKAIQVLSGRAEVSKPEDKPAEESNTDYAKKALEGKVEEK